MQSNVYPWRRYWARMFDITFIMPIYIFIIALFSPGLNHTITLMENITGSILLLLFYLIFFEPMMLSSFGTTPGKFLLGIKIRDSLGKKISYGIGMKRGFILWVNGMGLGIPMFAFFTLISSFIKLKRNGITSWDRRCGISVIHGRLTIFKVILLITLFIFCSSIWFGFLSNF